MKSSKHPASLRAAATDRDRLDGLRGGLGLGSDSKTGHTWTTAYTAAGKGAAGKPPT